MTARTSSAGTPTSTKCGLSKCSRKVTDLDYSINCEGCQTVFHQACAGFDEAGFKAFKKINQLCPFFCPACRSGIKGMSIELSSLRQEMSDLKKQREMPDFKIMIRDIVQEILPVVLKTAREEAAEVIKAEGKKNNLVLVGLGESVGDREFVEQACEKVNIDPGHIVACFRSGGPVSGGRSRIVKVKFSDSGARRSFLLGFRGVRDSLNGGAGTWVRPDLTYRQRCRDRELREKLMEARKDNLNLKISRGQIVPK